MEMIHNTFRDLFAVGAFSLLCLTWVLLEPGIVRNLTLMGSTAVVVVLLWGIKSANQHSEKKTTTRKTHPKTSTPTRDSVAPPEDPRASLEACLRYHRVVNHPAAEALRNRVNDYREVVVKMAAERAGHGTMWRDPDTDTRVRACMCGELTRDEVIQALDLEIADVEPPRVGAGMGIAPVLAGESRTRGSVLAEDGHPATRVLVDPEVDNAISALVVHRPEARSALLAARDRYMENILRRLIGPLDDKGRAVVPLCKWKKRFDGDYYEDFERIEKGFIN